MGYICKDPMHNFRKGVTEMLVSLEEKEACFKYTSGLPPPAESKPGGAYELDLYRRCAISYDFAGSMSNHCSLFEDPQALKRCEDKQGERMAKLGAYLGVVFALFAVGWAFSGKLSFLLLGGRLAFERQDDIRL